MPTVVRFTIRVAPDSDEEVFKLKIHEEWAPLGARRFLDLVQDKNFDGGAFYRVIPGFMAQFGIAADPAMYKKWSQMIPDDKVTQSNTRGRISFAMRGPNTRSCQVFINFGDNGSLDSQGFAPFGEVIEGMEVVDKIYSGYQDAPYREPIKEEGVACIKDKFPKLSYVVAAVVED
uniref:Peptidyl-prolyl cis-trans isomerase n=1 Tax=Pyrodinium bahamense TaxID=73915 RepID=A0A7S0B3K6_9DINO|mmetsp:Transcript_47828/g.132907  ORF Transcript_47828/g.132907 Transcript_47828/m.132907 type:complete len:175 (+) Transcript_47828:85-609(+)